MNNPISKLINIIRYRFNLDEGKASDEEVIEHIRKGVEFKGINLWTLIFAILIASIGLNVNSTAVIIGAMLISPLMGPIMGIGMGAAIFDFDLIQKAAKNLFIATVISLLTSTLYFFISPLDHAQSELLARTSPTIWDVMIAFFGGLAGIVASSRKQFNNVIPGVAIATALMPPLCTAGFGLATMQWSYFLGAFYLYMINSVFISIATFLMARALKYHTITYVDKKLELKVKRFVFVIAVLTILPSIYLAYHFVNNEIFKQRADTFIKQEIIKPGLTILSKEIEPENKSITILFLGLDNLDSVKHELELKKLGYNLHQTILRFNNKQIGAKKTEEINVDQLKEGIIENIIVRQEEEIKKKDEEINSLKQVLVKSDQFNDKKQEAVSEFEALYGKPKEMLLERTLVARDSLTDTILMVYIKPSRRLNSKEYKQIENWLQTKFRFQSTKLIID